MLAPTQRLASAVLASIEVAPPGTVAPRFHDAMRHTLLPAREYLIASREDHAPLTDLRIHRDESSRAMLDLNIAALVEAIGSDWLGRAIEGGPADETIRGIVEAFALNVQTSAYARPRDGGGAEDVYVALLTYVNGFGGWDDALAIASGFAARCERHEEARPRWLASMLAGVVLGLHRREHEGAALVDQAMTGLAGTAEAFFAGLRWASLEVKRRGRLDVAERYLDRAADIAVADTGADRLLFLGLRDNVRGLIALKRGSKEEALSLVDSAIACLRASAESDDESGAGLALAERARYYWMARLNRIQLDIFAGALDSAARSLRELVVWAEAHDARAVHSTLSVLGFVLVRQGRPAEAVSVLSASLDRLRTEYDPSVVRQVRKMLIRCFGELGEESLEKRVRDLTPYFWQKSAAFGRSTVAAESSTP
ncbi:hypothetical protein IT072_01400 [Leifsonia sp. ZF2019]|uniref:hypothetical protein n=1 Tax=Leifsonia sp. ZF2019 TaxID=2781978 RepID=UPI001CC19F43|nr:hypothetical protein [Leifsonia sp. ZF2019]UAJ79774.1 hypothetical protein IT072_01400 [Leifsonia sp. ZF2019]